MINFLKHLRYLLEGIATWTIYFIFKILPIDVASRLGGKLMRMAGPHLKAAATAKANLKMCYPQMTDAQIAAIMTDMWDNLGRIVGELPHVVNLSEEEFNKRCTITGPPEFQKSAIFVSGHLGNFELATRILRHVGINASLVYRPVNNIYVNNLIRHLREKNSSKLIAKGKPGLKNIMEILQHKGSVAMLVDQKLTDGIDTKFFGFHAKTTGLPAKLAIKYQIPIYIAYMQRLKGCKFNIVFKEILPSEIKRPEDLTQHINDILEGWIRADPAQWFWVHRRWD